jgi:protein kinase
MENCKLVSNLGFGAFGSIWKVINQTTKEVVVIKKLKRKYSSMDECIKLMEVHVLLRLMNHPNIIHLKQLVFEKKEIFFVFEQITNNLQQIIKYKD